MQLVYSIAPVDWVGFRYENIGLLFRQMQIIWLGAIYVIYVRKNKQQTWVVWFEPHAKYVFTHPLHHGQDVTQGHF